MKYIGVMSFMFCCCSAVAASIEDVTAVQRYPWNDIVDITYTVVGDIDGFAYTNGLLTAIKVTATDKDSGESYVAAHLQGETNLTAGVHSIRWNLDDDAVKLKSSNVVFTVSCETEEATYCVIDLSGGTNATNYAVTYMNEIPDGSWSDEYKTDKLVLKRINPGTFIMGSNQTNELHRITLTKPFYMGVFEVTQTQWLQVMGSWPNSYPGSRYGANNAYPACGINYFSIRGGNWPTSSEVASGTFISKLQTKTGLSFDLPTEAQWEYACRAGTTTAFSFGDSADGDYMWYSINANSSTHKVGTKNPNPWGLYDMHGNVMEWNLDWYEGTLIYGYDPKGSSNGSHRVVRGGTWLGEDGKQCSSFFRNSYIPSYYENSIGFRLSVTIQ